MHHLKLKGFVHISFTAQYIIPFAKSGNEYQFAFSLIELEFPFETNTHEFSRISERLAAFITISIAKEVLGGRPSTVSCGGSCSATTPQQCLQQLLFISSCRVDAVDRYFGIRCRRRNESVDVLQSRSNHLSSVLEMLSSAIAICLSLCNNEQELQTCCQL